MLLATRKENTESSPTRRVVGSVITVPRTVVWVSFMVSLLSHSDRPCVGLVLQSVPHLVVVVSRSHGPRCPPCGVAGGVWSEEPDDDEVGAAQARRSARDISPSISL
ncbi:hypothetical protein GCM10009570_09830 [Dietzia natronolimnaea]